MSPHITDAERVVLATLRKYQTVSYNASNTVMRTFQSHDAARRLADKLNREAMANCWPSIYGVKEVVK